MRGSPYTDLDRPPLHAANLRRALVVPGGLWTRVDVHAQTASTNADAAQAAREGVAEGLVVLAERQSAGRGRLGRRWESPARAGLAASMLLRPADPRPAAPPQDRDWPAAPPSRYGWLSLLAGVALAGSVARVAGLEAALKWPNDLLVDGRKCAGILAEAVPAGNGDPGARGNTGARGNPGARGNTGAVVVGIGLNVTLRADELPNPDTTSLRLAGAGCTDRDPLLRALLRGFAQWYGRWREAGGDPEASGLREAYLGMCATLGQDVRIGLPDGTSMTGRATTVDTDGRLVVRDDDGVRAVAAGDVVHVRRANFKTVR